jgi:transcriptional regulator with XRE-family HTH domain
MGKAPRRKPARLAEKLLEIRRALGLSQNGMIRRLGETDELTQAEISAYERGVRVPSLLVLLKYSDIAMVWIDVLVNDALDLPPRLPSRVKHEGMPRTTATKAKTKTISSKSMQDR